MIRYFIVLSLMIAVLFSGCSIVKGTIISHPIDISVTDGKVVSSGDKAAIFFHLTVTATDKTKLGQLYYVFCGDKLVWNQTFRKVGESKTISTAEIVGDIAMSITDSLLRDSVSRYQKAVAAYDKAVSALEKHDARDAEIMYDLFWGRSGVPSMSEVQERKEKRKQLEQTVSQTEKEFNEARKELDNARSNLVVPSNVILSHLSVRETWDKELTAPPTLKPSATEGTVKPVATTTATPTPIPSVSVDTSVKWPLSTPISSLPQPPAGYGYWKGPSGYNLAPLGSALPNYLYSWVTLTPTPRPTK